MGMFTAALAFLASGTATGRDGHRVEALPVERNIEILKKYNVVRR